MVIYFKGKLLKINLKMKIKEDKLKEIIKDHRHTQKHTKEWFQIIERNFLVNWGGSIQNEPSKENKN